MPAAPILSDPAASPEEFRAALQIWLEENAPHALRGTVSTPFQGYWGGTRGGFPDLPTQQWFERCLAMGWTAPAWPRRYGGAGLPTALARIFKEELQRMGLPLPLVGFGLAMIGPILLVEGTEAQKEQHLPAIIQGEIRWCQGYSEPDAGSDLASLRMPAIREGDEFVVSGQKIWTSHADSADWIFCLVRTDTTVKHAGITFLLIDMRSPGITVRPISLISGASPFCEVFFDQVRVPVSNVVGQIGDGWRVAKALLRHERGMVGESVAAGGARLPVLQGFGLRQHAIDTIGRVDGKLADGRIRDALVRFEMELTALRQTLQRSNDKLRVDGQPGPESAIFKVVGTELNQVRWELAVEIAGLAGLGWSGAPYTEVEQALARQWLRSRGNTIEGGTNEIQRNIIARRVLGLPK